MINDDEKTIGCVLAVVAVALAPIGYVLNGYALTFLWQWFIVAKFGLPVLNIPEAIGVAIVAGFLTKQIQPTEEHKSVIERFIMSHSLMVLKPALALLIGWFVKGFL